MLIDKIIRPNADIEALLNAELNNPKYGELFEGHEAIAENAILRSLVKQLAERLQMVVEYVEDDDNSSMYLRSILRDGKKG